MNIIIPMGGIGSRFERDNYRFPKPLINIVGHPMLYWLLDNLSIDRSNDVIWMAVMTSVENIFHFKKRVCKQYPKHRINVVTLDFETRGPAETVFVVLQHMKPDDLKRRTICLDCDTIYFSDVLADFRRLDPGVNASFCFEDKIGQPVFSYIAMDDQQNILDIKEKMPISTWANTGAYGFASGELLKQFCVEQLDTSVDSTGEYYTSAIIRLMLSQKQPFKGVNVSDFYCVGSPDQLTDFLHNIRIGKIKSPRTMRFCFDLDNTLLTYPLVEGDYTSCQPMEKNIQLVRELKAAGHYIIISTARRMKTHGGNVGAVIKDIGWITLNALETNQIPYDELHFGKPHADIYVDDLAVNAFSDTEKELGWSLITSGRDSSVPARQLGVIEARNFNKVTFVDNYVIKSSHNDIIRGERFFYEHMPADIAHLFPRLLESSTEQKTNIVTIKLEQVKGVTYSHLSINRCLTDGRLLKLLRALHALHSSQGHPGDRPDPATLDLYQNYAPKVRARYAKSRAIYDAIDPVGVKAAFDTIVAALDNYEAEKLAVYSHVIHGDPVFSNVLLKSDGNLVMIDMRGQLGGHVTMQGDRNYDLAKLYQSLWGYDFVLLDKEDNADDEALLAHLRHIFLQFVTEKYAQESAPSIYYLDILTASLYLSLIPLHDAHHRQFFGLCQKVLAHSEQYRPASLAK
ncbi:hypothetical protein CAOG_03776 [Capsaspora owczarzaki ATCC 30864]|uniref:Nucleotidyl transferase domain-containing protein n=1 Tax=Capsaspora owczarzaki (strain ATCC 30864) TaxID=595528 RepID=A0A0D2WPY4_CAPO3|nr:hypothetical protein CAOG_03776 [Capsaspora owczarzaki ATCC 30864]KJE92888.1 hypothetical protein CAOG_003776 [Capsaspora owczarzaki ATCC 30864]|eukprot:XP_004363504.1 hypothetical protein CAOG_03776 [Capsaspora owczarzaki ATCC 30864]